MTATAFLDRWAKIEQGQRWTIQNHQMQAISAGPNSGRLIDALNYMATAIQSLSQESQYRTSDIQGKTSRLSQLATDKVTRYQSCHCWLYHFFMRVIGRDPTTALARFQSSIAEFDRLYNRGFKVETAQLTPLLEDSRFSDLKDRTKRSLIGAFIELLPLKETLSISNEDIVEALFSTEITGFTSTNHAQEAFVPMTQALLRLLKNQKNWTLRNNCQEICDFAEHSFKRYFYHATTLEEWQDKIQHCGIRKNGQDYSLKEIAFSRNSSFHLRDQGAPLVTDCAFVAYHETVLPLAVDDLLAISRQLNATAPGDSLPRVPTKKAMVMLQIEVPMCNESSYEPSAANTPSQHLEETLFKVFHRKIQGTTFSPTKISAFVVPRLTL